MIKVGLDLGCKTKNIFYKSAFTKGYQYIGKLYTKHQNVMFNAAKKRHIPYNSEHGLRYCKNSSIIFLDNNNSNSELKIKIKIQKIKALPL
jgi:hypothetical protein